MNEQDRKISEIVAEQRSRLRNFIRRRVPNPSDVEDIVQEVFFELVEANRLLMPIDHVTGWLFRVARNRITDLFRKKRPEAFSDEAPNNSGDGDRELMRIEEQGNMLVLIEGRDHVLPEHVEFLCEDARGQTVPFSEGEHRQ